MGLNFIKVNNANVDDLMKEVVDNSHLFGAVPLRTGYPDSAHKQVVDIILRGPKATPKSTMAELQNAIPCVNWNPFDSFPIMRKAVMELMHQVEGEQLGRVIITKLHPGGAITPHVDEGDAANFYTRYHLVLHGMLGNFFASGDEAQEMLTGEVWYINNHIEHSVVNDSREDRIHLIIDIKTNQ